MSLEINGLAEHSSCEEEYKEGRRLFLKFNNDDNWKAQGHFKNIIETCPDNGFFRARALGHLAYAILTAWRHGWSLDPNQSNLDLALTCSQDAVLTGPLDYDNYWSRGAARIYKEDFGGGLSDYQRAFDLFFVANHGNDEQYLADLMIEWSESLILSGHAMEAVRKVWIVKQLLKGHNRKAFADWVLGWACYFAGAASDEANEKTTAEILYGMGESTLSPYADNKKVPPVVKLDLAVLYISNKKLESAKTIMSILNGGPDAPSEAVERKRWKYSPTALPAFEKYLTHLKEAGLKP